MFCKKDQCAICVQCVSTHDGHGVCALEDVANEMRGAFCDSAASGRDAAKRARVAKDPVDASIAAIAQVCAPLRKWSARSAAAQARSAAKQQLSAAEADALVAVRERFEQLSEYVEEVCSAKRAWMRAAALLTAAVIHLSAQSQLLERCPAVLDEVAGALESLAQAGSVRELSASGAALAAGVEVRK
jgi:HPt (histidine-containing phosphotransfer) domain-containing protein